MDGQKRIRRHQHQGQKQTELRQCKHSNEQPNADDGQVPELPEPERGFGFQVISAADSGSLSFFSIASNNDFPPFIDFFHVCQHAAAISVVTLKAVRHVIAVLAAFIVAAHSGSGGSRGQSGAHRLMCRLQCFDLSTMIVHLQERKKAGTSEKKSRLSANITLSVPLWGAAPVPAAAKAARSAPVHFGAAFLRHRKVSRRLPAQTRKHF